LPIPEPIEQEKEREREKKEEAKMSKTFSVADVAAHKDAENGMYIIVDENVYDVTGKIAPISPNPRSLSPIPNIPFPSSQEQVSKSTD
jgi:hypothetical protein